MSQSAGDAFLGSHPELLEEDLTDRSSLELLVRLGALLAFWHRFRLDGVERLPAGPCLLVANHDIGAFSVGLLVVRGLRMAAPRPELRVLAHRFFWMEPFRSIGWVQRLGALLAHPEVAERALRHGERVLVFPGGELEGSRRDAAQLTLGGRSGFVRLARRAGVPIVPVVISGAHGVYVLLPGSEMLARLFRLDRIGVRALPMTLGGVGIVAALAATLVCPLALPLVPLATLQALWPLPVRIRAEVLAPVVPEAGEPDEAVAERVRSALQAALRP